MNHSRRDFLVLAAGATAALGLDPAARGAWTRARTARAPETWFEWKDIGTGGKLRVAIGDGGNALVMAAKDRSLLIDCKNAGYGAALLREARLLGPKQVVVINTHHHADHTGGNSAIRPGAEKIIAHARCKARIEDGGNTARYRSSAETAAKDLAKSAKPASKDVLRDAQDLVGKLADLKPADFAPTDTIAQDTELEVGGERILLRHAGPGHTDNDVFVLLPKHNVLHTGDLLFNKLHPVMDRPGGATCKGWLVSLKAMIDLCDGETVVVPGHGAVTNVDGLKTQVAYFETTRDAVAKAIDKGTPRSEVEKIALDDYKDYGMEQARARALGAIYDELAEEQRGATK